MSAAGINWAAQWTVAAGVLYTFWRLHLLRFHDVELCMTVLWILTIGATMLVLLSEHSSGSLDYWAHVVIMQRQRIYLACSGSGPRFDGHAAAGPTAARRPRGG